MGTARTSPAMRRCAPSRRIWWRWRRARCPARPDVNGLRLYGVEQGSRDAKVQVFRYGEGGFTPEGTIDYKREGLTGGAGVVALAQGVCKEHEFLFAQIAPRSALRPAPARQPGSPGATSRACRRSRRRWSTAGSARCSSSRPSSSTRRWWSSAAGASACGSRLASRGEPATLAAALAAPPSDEASAEEPPAGPRSFGRGPPPAAPGRAAPPTRREARRARGGRSVRGRGGGGAFGALAGLRGRPAPGAGGLLAGLLPAAGPAPAGRGRAGLPPGAPGLGDDLFRGLPDDLRGGLRAHAGQAFAGPGSPGRGRRPPDDERAHLPQPAADRTPGAHADHRALRVLAGDGGQPAQPAPGDFVAQTTVRRIGQQPAGCEQTAG